MLSRLRRDRNQTFTKPSNLGEMNAVKSIADLLVLNADRYPENMALVYGDLRFTYRQLNKRVNRLAAHLIRLGVEKGDRVGFMFYNSHRFAEIFLPRSRSEQWPCRSIFDWYPEK